MVYATRNLTYNDYVNYIYRNLSREMLADMIRKVESIEEHINKNFLKVLGPQVWLFLILAKMLKKAARCLQLVKLQ